MHHKSEGLSYILHILRTPTPVVSPNIFNSNVILCLNAVLMFNVFLKLYDNQNGRVTEM